MICHSKQREESSISKAAVIAIKAMKGTDTSSSNKGNEGDRQLSPS
ncbi:MAG: hypothetical protein AB7V16_12110 [Vulcanibacillus sp.]